LVFFRWHFALPSMSLVFLLCWHTMWGLGLKFNFNTVDLSFYSLFMLNPAICLKAGGHKIAGPRLKPMRNIYLMGPVFGRMVPPVIYVDQTGWLWMNSAVGGSSSNPAVDPACCQLLSGGHSSSWRWHPRRGHSGTTWYNMTEKMGWIVAGI